MAKFTVVKCETNPQNLARQPSVFMPQCSDPYYP